jgi:hypothetical protein
MGYGREMFVPSIVSISALVVEPSTSVSPLTLDVDQCDEEANASNALPSLHGVGSTFDPLL